MSPLELLLSDDFIADIGFYSTYNGVYGALTKSHHVKKLSDAIKNHEIGEQLIGEFTHNLLAKLERGKIFPFDLQLSAIAVALEDVYIPFTEQYFADLARIRLTEFQFSPKVAALCMNNLTRVPKHNVKQQICKVSDIAHTPNGSIEWEYRSSIEMEAPSNISFDDQCAA